MQRILVCAQDPVLAKKVRFLMERDECKVDILASASELERRLASEPPSLLVLSRQLEADDAVDLLGRLDPAVELPPTLVLGGQDRVTADFIHLVPDPVDTQAIYREASRLLQARRDEAAEPATDASVEPLEELESIEPLDPIDDEEIALSEEDALGGIAHELDALEAAEMDEKLSDAFEPEHPAPEEAPVKDAPTPSAAPAAPNRGADARPLDPADFARQLHRAWSGKESGAIVVERDDERTTVCFEDGRPVFVGSSLPGDRLGRALVARDRLSETQYAEAAMRVVESGVGLPDAIVELGFLGEEELAEEMGTSARERLVACFSARDGQFWRDPAVPAPAERRFRLEVGHVIAEGLRSHADERVIDAILGDQLSSYFSLLRPAYELQKDFPLAKVDMDFLAYSGRAYNVEDASDSAGLPLSEARRLLAILAVTSEVEPFQPGAKEFEDRIRDERATRRELESRMPGHARSAPPSPPGADEPPEAPDATRAETPPPFFEGPSASPGAPPSFPPPDGAASQPDPTGERGPTSGSFPPPGKPTSTSSVPIVPPPMPPAPEASEGAAAPRDPDIPAMPTPSGGEGVVPRPLAYAKPLPRAADGSVIDTPERNLSREHFQKGVGLLGKGNFSSAEEAFRDAVALCSEEHVYLIGLARAIYYNPSYRADGKLPILESIVDRARRLAPDDKRVSTLASWVEHARDRAR